MSLRGLLVAALLASCPVCAADIQRERKALISDLIKANALYKLEKPARYCHAWVGPRFDSMPFDQKDAIINVVYAYCVTADASANIVVLKDYRTGKEIGNYGPSYGGLSLK